MLKDPLRLYRYATDGARTLKGDPVKDEFTTLELFYQALGFTPIALARQYAENSAIKNKEKHIEDRRQGILVEFDDAVRAGQDTAAIQKRIEAFNEQHPGWAISGKNLRQSIRSRARRRAEMRNGIHVNPKLADELGVQESVDVQGEE